MVDTKDGTVIYSGFLINYVCHGEQLDRIYLGDAVRREFKKAVAGDEGSVLQNEPGLPTDIPGNVFSLAYNNAINLNLRFIVIDESIEEIEQFPDEN